MSATSKFDLASLLEKDACTSHFHTQRFYLYSRVVVYGGGGYIIVNMIMKVEDGNGCDSRDMSTMCFEFLLVRGEGERELVSGVKGSRDLTWGCCGPMVVTRGGVDEGKGWLWVLLFPSFFEMMVETVLTKVDGTFRGEGFVRILKG
ncbi:unnamed protein product [Dovyalis caffra]|uniref:Uncharacterized protein n=1 Tax=Dovyalis caffra TaxID=77055 RepID=A0AAV1SGB2_9ROSI|nr:unnamed protein product [Dovyalis caffra]